MPRRMITSELWFNEKVSSLPDAGRLLFIGIFSNADNDGRLKSTPKYLKGHIFPYDEDKTLEQIAEWRDMCAEVGLIRLYRKDGQEYLDLPGWDEHQSIRKDRYKSSELPSFNESNEPTPTNLQPTDNQPPTVGGTKKGKVKKGEVKKDKVSTPKGARSKRADPTISEIYSEMRNFLGYPDIKVCGGEAVPAIEENSAMTADRRVDPIPNYGKEGKAISRMLTRGFTREEIVACWKDKVSQRGGEFVSMTWVNNDISSKGDGHGASRAKTRKFDTPVRTDGGTTPEEYAADEAAHKARRHI